MKVSVDAGRCRGHGVCLSACPDVFTLNEYGYAEATVSRVAPKHAAGVAETRDMCHERAIEVGTTRVLNLVEPPRSRTSHRIDAPPGA